MVIKSSLSYNLLFRVETARNGYIVDNFQLNGQSSLSKWDRRKDVIHCSINSLSGNDLERLKKSKEKKPGMGGRVALVQGASRGIGLQFCRHILKRYPDSLGW